MLKRYIESFEMNDSDFIMFEALNGETLDGREYALELVDIDKAINYATNEKGLILSLDLMRVIK